MEAPLAERAIIGTTSEVLESLKATHAKIGFDLLIVRPQFARVADDPLEESLTLLTEEVWPALLESVSAATE